MKNVLILSILLLIGTISFLGCKSNDPEPCIDCEKQSLPRDTIYNNDTFLSYCFFPEGSWWIYKRTDTTANVFDTVTVVSDRRFIYGDWTSHQNDFERIFQEKKHSNNNYLGFDLKYEQIEGNNAWFPDVAEKNTIGGAYFTYPDTEGNNNIGNGYIAISSKDTLKLPFGIVSSHIRIVPDVGYAILLVKNIGFCKITTPKEGTWELTEYYINK
jgi:hypothetical protein